MLYLAEVQKQRGGLLSGAGKSELKLIACQRSDQSWTNVSDEMITADEASKLNDGALVLVELSPSRQVQRIQEAGRPLVNILQNFSRQVEKLKVKEDEIDQWKQSLMIQVQELNRREMEMESRWEQLQQLEEDFKRLDHKKHEVDTSQEEIKNLKAELARNKQELEGAWEHLRGEQRRLEEAKAGLQHGGVLDKAQSQRLKELLSRLSNNRISMGVLKESIQVAMKKVEKQQSHLTPHWQQLDMKRETANQQEQEINELRRILSDRQSQLEVLESSLEGKTIQFSVKKALVNSKQDLCNFLRGQIANQNNLRDKLNTYAANLEHDEDEDNAVEKVDVELLRHLPLEELQRLVQEYQEKLDRDSVFVQEQEAELKYKQETIEELKKKVELAFGEELVNLEAELKDEQDLYQMLNKSVGGQRRSLGQRRKILKHHQTILRQRQGDGKETMTFYYDLDSIIFQVENERQQISEELGKFEVEIEQMLAEVTTVQGVIDSESQVVESKREEIKSLQEKISDMTKANLECWGRINLYQEFLQPIQDDLDAVLGELHNVYESLNQCQEIADHQFENITEMSQAMHGLINS